MTISPEANATLLQNVERVAAYTSRYAELKLAHHWLYDSRYPRDGSPQFVVLGVNPGETKQDFGMHPGPTEESSRSDYHDPTNRGRSSARWRKLCQYFLGNADYVLAEIFFWSSASLGQPFTGRYGRLEASPHLKFCSGLNRQLIEIIRPRAVVAPGLKFAQLCASLYSLKHEETARSKGGSRLVERYTDGKRPWLFTKHWSGAFGFSNPERERVRDEIEKWSRKA